MPDYINLLKQKQAEKDQALQQKEPGADVMEQSPNPSEPKIGAGPNFQQEPLSQEEQNEKTVSDLYNRELNPLWSEPEVRENLPENPYTWTPEYTQRGFVEEVGTSLARGFGKHVIGGTGDIVQLVNGIIPGWEIREGNMLSRALQEVGKEFEEDYQVYMPDELKDNEFSVKTFMNPGFWSKTAAEYIPQLVEMIILSKGAGAAAKAGAKSAVKGIGESMTKEALETIGQKVVINTTERVAGGVAKKASKVVGQGAKKDWRSAFITTAGEATEGLATGAEMFGGGVGMNFLSGLQNAGQLMNEMKILKDPETGEFLYDENQLAQMAATTMTENMKYLPVDMLSYGMVYAKNTGQFNKLLNPFGKKQSKKFFNSAEQLVATSKSFTQEAKPIMGFLDKLGNRLGRYAERGRKVGSAVAKPIFEGVEEQFQESWEEWATKKARARVTGEALTIDGVKNDSANEFIGDYMTFFFSKENEATRTIAMALGMLGGAGSNIVEAVNRKAEQQFKNYSKTELMKHAATDSKGYDLQTKFIKEQLVDNAVDGNVDSEAMIDEMVDTGVIAEDTREEWKSIAKELTLDAKKVKTIGKLNVAGQVAYLENKLRVKVAENGYATEQAKKEEKIKALNEELKNDPKTLKQELYKVEEAWKSAEAGFIEQIAVANKGVLNILSGEKADVSNIKHVINEDGNKVAVGLSEKDFNDYYNKTDEEVYADAKTKRIDPRPALSKMGNVLREFYKSATEKLGIAKDKVVEKGQEVIEKSKNAIDKQKEINAKKIKPITAESLKDIKDDIIIGEDSVDIESLKSLEGDAQANAIKSVNEEIKKYNDSLGSGRMFKEGEEALSEEEEKKLAQLQDAPKRTPKQFDAIVESTFEKTDKKNIITAENEVEKQVKDAKIDFKDEKEAREKVEALIKTGEGRIGLISRVEGVTTEELVDYVIKIGKEGSFKEESVAQKKKRIAAADKILEYKKKLEDARKKRPEYKNALQIQEANRFDDPSFKKEFNKAVKHDPNSRKKLQDEYDAYLESTIARATLKSSVITNQIAVNQHLRRLFPDTKIQVYAMSNLYAAIGENALGYAIGSSIMIDEKAWNQNDIFMHEFLHIHYELTKNEPATIAILKEAAKDKKMLEKIYRVYADQVVYAYQQPGWKPGTRKAKGIKSNMNDNQVKALNSQLETKHKNLKPVAYALPFERQPILQDELFAHYMQGPLSKEFNMFFEPRTDFQRQIKVKSWWKWLKNKAVDNEEPMIDVLKTLNQGKDVPLENLKSHIMNTFVSELRGKNVNLRGRMALSDEQTLVMSDQNDDVAFRLEQEHNIKKYQKPKALAEAVDVSKIGTVNDDFDVWAQQEEVEGEDLFAPEDDFQKLVNNSGEMDLGTYWDDGFDTTNLKNTKLVRYFVIQFNKMANQRKTERYEALKKASKDSVEAGKSFYDENGELIDATFYEGLNLNKFTENLIDIAKAYSSPVDFIRTLENSNIYEQQEFVKHLKKEFSDPLTRLTTMHLLYANSEVLPAIVHFVGKDGKYVTKTPQATQDPIVIRRTLERVENADTAQVVAVKEALDIIERQEQPQQYDRAIDTIMRFYGHDTAITEKVIHNGRLFYNKQNQTLYSAIREIMKSVIVDGTVTQGLDSDTAQAKAQAETIISAILNTGKKYASTSVVVSPTGTQATTRMFSNHAIKLFNRMVTDLKNSENTSSEKADFINKYNNGKEPVSTGFNPLLEGFWDNYHNSNELPLLVLDLGSQNELYDKSKNYKDASAEQQLLNEMLQFNDSIQSDNKNYFASMDILGDSSRRILSALPRINNILNRNNTLSENHVAKMYKIYTAMSTDKRALVNPNIKQKLPATYGQFKTSLQTAIDEWGKYLTDKAEHLSKIQSLEFIYEKDSTSAITPKLSKAGQKLVSEFTLNRIANTFYTHEILSPGLLLDTITKYHKGQIAPVIQLDPDLKVEMIPMAHEFKIPKPLTNDFKNDSKAGYDKAVYDKALEKWEVTKIITNDGIQYILEEHAESISQLNPEFGRGYKLYSHTIEKENPYFMNQTSQMKGYTTILSKEEVTGKMLNGKWIAGSQQHLFPIWKLLNDRNDKFKAWYKKTYDEDYNPRFRTRTSIDPYRPKYIPIIVPVSADKSHLFSTKELAGFEENYTLNQLKDPAVLKNFNSLLDSIYYPKAQGFNSEFVGIDGSNFGPQQIMDKRYDRATLSIQAITSIPFAQERNNLLNAVNIQDFISRQKWINLKTNVFDKIDENDDHSYSDFIVDTANALDSDPYTIRAMMRGEMPYSPHVAEFALNQFRAQMIRHGNNLSVPGTYGQTISDMGYKFVNENETWTNEFGETVNVEAYINKSNRDKIFPDLKEEYINGTSALNFYGLENITKTRADGSTFPSTRTKPFEIVLPKRQRGDQTIARKSFYSITDGGRGKAYEHLTGLNKDGTYKQIVTLRRLNLVDQNDKLNKEAIDKLLSENRIFSSPESTNENHIGTYIPGETVIMTRIPHNGPAFVGVAEVVGYHSTGASNIIVPAEYTNIIGADHDGDALFVYKQAKRPDGSLDTRMGDKIVENKPDESAGYGNWNQAFDMLVEQWLSHNMRVTLLAPLDFEKETDAIIEKNDKALNPEKYKKIDAINGRYNNQEISKVQKEKLIAEALTEADFVMPFSPQHYKEQYNNSVIAKQTVGVAFNTHRAIGMIATYKTRLSNGLIEDVNGNPVTNFAKITINGKSKDKFEDTPTPDKIGASSRIHMSTILANIVLDSTKNGHADALNLNLNSISSAMILVNLGFGIDEIGLLLNHPLAKDFINQRNDIGNDYIDNGSYNRMIYDYGQKYGADLDIYENIQSTNNFTVDVKPLQANGQKNPYYESKENNMNIIKLLDYLSKVSSDINIISNVTNGHNTLENNPFALEKNVRDMEALFNNDKRDSVENAKKYQTLYFNTDRTSKITINESPEINNYKRVALEYAKHQKKLNIANNNSVRQVFELVEKHITSEELTGNQLRHYTEKVMPFIYARLLGANNIELDEVLEIFKPNPLDEEPSLPLAQELWAYTQELDAIEYFKDPDNVRNKDTELTRSVLFKQGLIFDNNRIKLNAQVLQQHYSPENIDALKQGFSELPIDLQRKLVLYDLIKNGFTGEQSLYPLFPDNITDFITKRATEFQATVNDKKFNDNVVKDAFITLEDIETINPDKNYLPKLYLDTRPDVNLETNDSANFEIYKKLGQNKKVLKRILGTRPFRVTMIYKNEKNVFQSEVFQINPLGNLITEADRVQSGESNATDKQIARAKEKNTWNKMKRQLMTLYTNKGHILFESALPLTFKDKKVPNGELLNQIPNLPMIMIKDNSTVPFGGNLLDIMNKPLTEKAAEERKKKSNATGLGRFFRTDYNNYTSDNELTQEQLLNAYEYKQTLSERQKVEVWFNYLKDKALANNDKPEFVDQFGKLLKINPKTNNAFTEEELIQAYEYYGKMDAYATANITVPIMLELIQRESNYQTEHFTKIMEGEDDINVMKAWFQSNNIDSTHPATQAIQREIETEFKYFINERRRYLSEINKVTEDLYREKLNYNPVKTKVLAKLQLAIKLLFRNRDNVYRSLYGNIIKEQPEMRRNYDGQRQKRFALLSKNELSQKLKEGKISQAEYNFANTFRKITKELDPAKQNKDFINNGIPHIGASRLEAFSRKGILGVLTTSRPVNQAIYDVRLKFNNDQYTFKQIEDIFRQDRPSDWKNNIEYLKLRYKANSLFKKGKNEDGSKFQHSDVYNHTLLGDGMVNNFANGGWVNESDFLSLDLNKALSDFTHTQLFINGNENFNGFKSLQAKVDGLLLHNQMKGFDNQNKFVREVYKEYFLKAKKMNPDTGTDKVIDAFVRGNLLYIMGWKLLVLNKGLYAVGNVMIGKYNNIKNQGGKAWITGEQRYWGINQNGSKHRKAMGVLKNLNFMDTNFYDDVNISKSSGLDSIITDLALLPMVQTEKWIQGAHFLGMLTEEQWNRFDDNGDYKVGTTQILPEELIKIENTVKNSHGKGYSPTDQRLIQRYSWGRAIMQFARFIPTMYYDRFAKEEVNIYGQKHIGSLRAVWEPIAKIVGGEMSASQLVTYRAGLDAERRARFDSGLKGLAMVSLAIIAGRAFNSNIATELSGDANYLVNTEALEYKAFPSVLRTIKELLSSITGGGGGGGPAESEPSV